jgi:hypothetical protein
VFILAFTPRFERPPGPQLERTFEPVCPGAPVNRWRFAAKLASDESVRMEAMAMEALKVLMFRLLYAG